MPWRRQRVNYVGGGVEEKRTEFLRVTGRALLKGGYLAIWLNPGW